MLKKSLKALGALLAIALLAATVFAVNLIWFRPFSLNLFYEKVFISFVLEAPELLTSLGIAEQFGYRRHNAHLNDASEAKVTRDFETWHRHLADLKSYDFHKVIDNGTVARLVKEGFFQSLFGPAVKAEESRKAAQAYK